MPATPPPTSRPTAYLHIGLPKSGTTYIQNVLLANRAQLKANGILFPGPRWNKQVIAADNLIRYKPRSGRTPNPWDEMARSMVQHDGISLFSMEYLVRATKDQVRYALKTLEGLDVHVVLTVRDAVSVAPSQWQTAVRSGNDISWSDYSRTMPVAGRLSPRAGRFSPMRGLRNFAQWQGVPAIMDTWLAHVPPERFHVVVVPASRTQPERLWHRFAEVLDIDPKICSEPPAFRRPSLGYASASLVARVNGGISKHLRRRHAYHTTLRLYLSAQVLTERARAEAGIPLTRGVYRAGHRLNATNRRHITKRGVHLVGDLAELPVTPDATKERSLPTSPPPPDTEEMLAAAELAVRALEAQIREREGKVEPGSEPIGSWPERPDLVTRWRGAKDPEAAAVHDVRSLARRSLALGVAGSASDVDDEGEGE